MTIVGSGGVCLQRIIPSDNFIKEYINLDVSLQKRTDTAIIKLLQTPMPPGIRFEKLKGYRNPDIYTIHVTGNFKISLEIDGDKAFLRRVATHNVIDSHP